MKFIIIAIAALGMTACNTPNKSGKGGRGAGEGSDYSISFKLPKLESGSGFETFLQSSPDDLADGSVDDPSGATEDWSKIDAVIYRLIASDKECLASQVYSIDSYKTKFTFKVDPKCDYKLGVKIGTESNESGNEKLEFIAFYQTKQSYLITKAELKEEKEVLLPMQLYVTEAGTKFGFTTQVVDSDHSISGVTDWDLDPADPTDPTDPSDPGGGSAKLTYSDVKPIMDQYCVSCHSPGRSRPSSPLTSFDQVKTYATASATRMTSKNMPMDSTMDSALVDKFKAWIADGMLEKASGDGATPNNSNSGVVEFRIKAGTGRGNWNSEAEKVQIKVGQTLKVINDDSVSHQLHTNGTPCPHGDPIVPGASANCKISSAYSGRDLRDHVTYGAFYLEATQ